MTRCQLLVASKVSKASKKLSENSKQPQGVSKFCAYIKMFNIQSWKCKRAVSENIEDISKILMFREVQKANHLFVGGLSQQGSAECKLSSPNFKCQNLF